MSFHLQCVSLFPYFYATESFVDTSGGEVLSVAKELLSSRSEIVIESFTPCEPAVNKIEKRRRETNRKHKTALHPSLSRLLLTRNKRQPGRSCRNKDAIIHDDVRDKKERLLIVWTYFYWTPVRSLFTLVTN